MSSDSRVYTRNVLIFTVSSLIFLSLLSTSLSRSASAIGLQDNVKVQTELTNTGAQQDNADPFKSKDLKEKIGRDKECSDTPKVLDKELSADNKKSEQKFTSGTEGNGKNHFELPIDIPFP